MCGIFGYLGPDINKKTLLKMFNELKHRGPDESGFYLSPEIAIGIARLSIVDIKSGSQPIFNETKSIVVVGNGEIYNHKDLKQSLIKKGHIFKANSDIEVIIHLYEEYGLSSFSKLNGMFAIALWDAKFKKLILVRDAFGIKPLYYYHDKDKYIFSSEIKSILKLKVNTSPNIKELQRVLAYRSSSSKNTSFNNIYKVPASSILQIDKNLNLKRSTYRPYIESGLHNNHQENSLYFYKKSLEMCLQGDVPVGAFLSGGLDSSLNTALMSKILRNKYLLHTFTVGYHIYGDEFSYARSVSKFLNSRHHEVVVKTSDIIRDLMKIIWHTDEPILDPAFIPTYYLAKLASKYVKVVMVGDGADEVFAGYDKHFELFQSWKGKPNRIYEFFEKRMPFNFKELKKLHIPISNRTFDKLIKKMKQANSQDKYVKNSMYIDRVEMLPNLQLMKVDKSTMAHGLEARVPFLESNVVYHASKIPINHLMGKQPLKTLAMGLLPKNIILRKKKIFFVPIDHWMSEGMEEIAQKIIIRSTFLSELLNKPILLKQLSSLNAYQKWCLMVIDLWFRIFIERQKLTSLNKIAWL